MATVVTSSIGTGGGRTYSTIQAWIDDCPADLVAADQVWRGELCNDAEFTAGMVMPALTKDATRYVELTVAAGESAWDQPDVRTAPLAYDVSRGVGIRSDGTLFGSVQSYTRFSRMQLHDNDDGGRLIDANTATNIQIRNVLGVTAGNFYGGYGIRVQSSTQVNVVLIRNSTQTRPMFSTSGGTSTYRHCVAIRTVNRAAAGEAFATSYGTSNLQNCGAFGFTAVGSGTLTGDYNATDQASGMPGAHSVHSVAYSATAPFTEAGPTDSDLRPVTGSALASAGLLDATTAPTDLTGVTRPATPTIGVWELAAAPPSSFPIGAVVDYLQRHGLCA